MLLESEDSFPSPPEPPQGVNLDRPIDEKGHSAMHWAAAMGDISVVKSLLDRGARIDCLSNNLETPLMRAVMFTNNFDKQTMKQLVRILYTTVHKTDWFGSTVFHHISATTSSKNKYLSARYYMDTIINFLHESWVPDEITRLLNQPDQNGDTAVMIAAKHGARKCVRSLLGRNVQVDVPNSAGETADDLIRELNARRRFHNISRSGREASSSPFAPDGRGTANGNDALMEKLGMGPGATLQIKAPQFRSATANSLISRIAPAFQDRVKALSLAFESEYESKVGEEAEIERVIKKRVGEIDLLKRQIGEVGGLERELNASEIEQDEREEKELKALEAEAQSLLELEQREDLRNMVLKNSQLPPPSTSNGLGGNGSLAGKLQQVQFERQRLVKTIVGALGAAGLGERQEGYKRLIRGAIGVPESEIEGMLDEVLGTLEEEVREKAVGGEA
jgi:transcription factor MBP1